MRDDLTTLDAVKAQMGTTQTGIDAVLRTLISSASRMVTRRCGRSFLPSFGSRTYAAQGEHLQGASLLLDDDLLDATEISVSGAPLASEVVRLHPANRSPKHRLDLLAASGLTWAGYGADIVITGAWGYHEDYTNAWIDTLDAVQGGLDATSATLAVDNANGLDEMGRVRFENGALLRVDDECLRVVYVGVNTLTILRGQRGTTKAAHDAGAPLLRWAVQEDVEQATIALTIWLERNRETVGEKIRLLGGGEIHTMQAPDYLWATLAPYVKLGSLL